MANYDYGSPSPTPSPPPADGHTHPDLQHASITDIILHLRRRANKRAADGHSRHRQHQMQHHQQVYVISKEHVSPPVRRPDGTTSRSMVLLYKPHRPEATYPRHHHGANTAATPDRRTEHHHRANTAATPYHRRTEHHQRQNNHRDEVAMKVVCLSKVLSPGDRLDDDWFYLDFLEDVTREARNFRDLVKVVIPRPVPGAATVVAGVGKVFLEYACIDDAAWCRRRLDGRPFRGKTMAATFFSQDRLAAGDYGHDG
ncbi:unnamed protein product [Alopecurus aequalis]